MDATLRTVAGVVGSTAEMLRTNTGKLRDIMAAMGVRCTGVPLALSSVEHCQSMGLRGS